MFGRQAELDQLQRTLKSNFGKNTLLVGPTGVGKTVLVGELARQWHEEGDAQQDHKDVKDGMADAGLPDSGLID